MERRGFLLLLGLLAYWAPGPPAQAQRRTESSSSEERSGVLPRPPAKRCPSEDKGGTAQCGRMCSSAGKCPGDELCCRYGCRRECLHPVEVNPGYCPKTNPVATRPCGTNCTTDAECGKGKKCCRWGCFATCVDAEPAHPGVCPQRAVHRRSPCRNQCKDDRGCPPTQKCCFTGCRLECTDLDKDACEAPKESGSCTLSLEYFHYSATSRKCENFTFSGCKGNANRFYTEEDCLRACGRPVKDGMCPKCLEDSDSDSEECEVLCSSDSDCPGAERCCSCGCNQRCTLPVEVHPGYCPKPIDESSKQTICLANCTSDANCGAGKKCCTWGCLSNCVPAIPPHPGLCPNRKVLPTDAHCKDFCSDDRDCPASQKCCFSGCGLQCLDPKKEMCRLPAEKGPCKAYQPMYHYSQSTRTCEVFIYGGCGGNSNRFSSLVECLRTCKYPDTCRLPMDRGRCNSHKISYYYNHANKTCESFAYRGCDGNDNRFRTLEQCRSTCLYPEICTLPVDPGPCRAHVPMYYYDHVKRSCGPFTYGGCEGNPNRFHTLEECEQHCRNPEICALPPETGPCWHYSRMYHYSTSEETCLPFPYGGCKGNENRFPSMEKCMDTCGTQDLCKLPKEGGLCLAYIPRYYYNPANRTCERFIYGGCGGNENRFETEMECIWRCRNPDICKLPKDPGPCEALMPRYYYDTETKACDVFIYGGCKGNENRFPSLSECEHACKKPAACRLPMNPGEGGESIPMYYYDPVGTACDLFTFKGHKGNQNRFATLVECQETCRDPDICKLPQDPGPCEAHSPRFYYNSTTRLCSAFSYGNCRGNPNNFPSKEGCQLTCEGPEKPGSCPPADPTNCLITCQKDCECPGTQRCCSNQCGQVCKEPISAKPGQPGDRLPL